MILTYVSRRQIGRAALALLGIAAITACGPSKPTVLRINSTPPGAIVYLNGEELGESPVNHEFEGDNTFIKRRHEVRATMNGYEEFSTRIDHNWFKAKKNQKPGISGSPIYVLNFPMARQRREGQQTGQQQN